MADYRTPPGDGLMPIVDEFKKLRRGQRSLARPSGTNIASSLKSLEAAIAGMVYPVADGGWATNFSLTTTQTVVASCVLTVPTGYTRALVLATGTVSGQSNAAGSDFLYATVGVNGVLSFNNTYSLTTPNTNVATVAASTSASLSGLVDGATIPVDIRAWLNNGPAGGTPYSFAQVVVIATFLR